MEEGEIPSFKIFIQKKLLFVKSWEEENGIYNLMILVYW